MGSTVASRVLLLLLCLAVGDAVRHDVAGAAREYEKQEHERIEHEHVQAVLADRTSEVLRRVMVIAGRCWSACFPEIRVLQGLLTWEKGPQHLEPLAPLKSLVFDKLVSEGSFGQVFGGTWCGRRVAIKVLRSESSGIEEAMLMKSLCHPNVVEAIFFAEVAHELMGMQVWLVQEFCECGTWGSHCVSPRNAWAGLCEARDMCVEVCSACNWL
ncbi:Acvr1c, partial [Symbiodinium necroappetens]